MASVDAENIHRPVLLQEVMHLLGPENGGLFIDATIGMGGHSDAILAVAPSIRVIGIDQDEQALQIARERLAKYCPRILFFKANFAEVSSIVDLAAKGKPDGILADLGVSSLQLDSETRGFSFRFNAPLDMRMNAESEQSTVDELLATIKEEDLANIIYEFGEERASRKIARWIVEKREKGEPIRTTFELADLVRRAVPKSSKDSIHPATRTFQALRIAVNRELEILERFIFDSADLLKPNGVLAIITFHSLEDRIVKHVFQRLAGKCQCPPRIPQCVCGAAKRVEILTRKPVLPTEAEKNGNPRSRSSKLRAFRKI